MNLSYPKQPKLIETVSYLQHEDASLYLTRFIDDDIPALIIGNEKLNKIYKMCNFNPFDYELIDFEFAIVDREILSWLIENGYLEQPHNRYFSKVTFVSKDQKENEILRLVSNPDSFKNETYICQTSDKLKKRILELCT